MAIGASEAETFWVDFLRKLKRRGLAGVKLVISDAHEGIKAAVARVFRASWQRCRVHFMRNALAHAGKSGRRVVSAFIATAFAQDHADAAKAQWRQVPSCPSSPRSWTRPRRTSSPTWPSPRSTGPRSTRRMRSTRVFVWVSQFLRSSAGGWHLGS
jgi:transposase-like protein